MSRVAQVSGEAKHIAAARTTAVGALVLRGMSKRAAASTLESLRRAERGAPTTREAWSPMRLCGRGDCRARGARRTRARQRNGERPVRRALAEGRKITPSETGVAGGGGPAVPERSEGRGLPLPKATVNRNLAGHPVSRSYALCANRDEFGKATGSCELRRK